MLLRFLQQGEVRPLGSTETTRVDVRLISATHRNLKAAVREGAFCETHEHNPQTHTTIARSATKSFLDRHGVPQGDTLLRLRHPLVHGSLPYDFAKWLVIRESLPSLARAVEDELRDRLGLT